MTALLWSCAIGLAMLLVAALASGVVQIRLTGAEVRWRWPEWWRWCGMVGAAGAFWINEGLVAQIICGCLFMAFAVRIDVDRITVTRR